jgi:CubicO group peptidase (beta-lactamase class C family)
MGTEGSAAAPAVWQRRAAAIDAAVERAAAQGQIVGAVVLVAQHGQTVHARATGLAAREAGRPMTLDTLFRYSSLTKPIVTAAALALVEEGTLDLHAPVTSYLPQFRPRLPDGSQPVITLHHLLTHTAGLSYPWDEPGDGPYHSAGIADGIGPSGITLGENVERIAGVPLLFPPGTRWAYSVALDVTGAVLEAATGEPLPAVVARKVTAPLAMRDSAFSVLDPARLAAAYADGESEPVLMRESHQLPFGASRLVYSPQRAWDARAFPSGGAGMMGSAPDLLRFLEAIRAGGAPILPPVRAAQMLSAQTGTADMSLLGAGWRFSYGGALLADPAAAGSPQSAGTWTWGGVYGHHWFVDPAQVLSVVVTTNTGIAGLIGPINPAIRDAVYQ